MTPRIERRRAIRRTTVQEHGIQSARVRPGVKVVVVDASAGGVLVESSQRLLPGMPMEVHVERQSRVTSVRGRVLRCSVCRLSASAVCYRGAIGFDAPLAWLVGDLDTGSSCTSTNHEERPEAG